MKYMRYKKFELSRGYSLLLAVLIINIILAMSLGIFSITMKALQLAAFTKDSQKAFGVADRALECALYWNQATGWNGMTPPESIFKTGSTDAVPTNIVDAMCEGQRLTTETGWSEAGSTAATGTTNFTLTYPTESPCAEISVVRDDISTKITVNGYNTCASSNPRRIQRTIQVNM
jgi:hypothetical protein